MIHKKDTLYRKQQNIISLTYAGQTTTLALAEPDFIQEIQAPGKYYKSNEIYEFTYTHKNDETYEYIFFLMIILIKDLCPLGSLLAGIKYHSYSAVN